MAAPGARKSAAAAHAKDAVRAYFDGDALGYLRAYTSTGEARGEILRERRDLVLGARRDKAADPARGGRRAAPDQPTGGAVPSRLPPAAPESRAARVASPAPLRTRSNGSTTSRWRPSI